jgi:hypothetical protein
MKELRCPNCKRLLFKGDFIGNIFISCHNNKCSYHQTPIHFDFHSDIFNLIEIRRKTMETFRNGFFFNLS